MTRNNVAFAWILALVPALACTPFLDETIGKEGHACSKEETCQGDLVCTANGICCPSTDLGCGSSDGDTGNSGEIEISFGVGGGDACPFTNPVQVETRESGYAAGTLPSGIAWVKFTFWSSDETTRTEIPIFVEEICDNAYTCMQPSASSFILRSAPVQQNMHLKAEGFDSANELIWIGHTYNVDVSSSDATPTPVNIHMNRVGKMTWGLGCMSFGKVFHTATRLRDGRVLVVGGASDSYPDSCEPEEFGETAACDLYVATKDVQIYDPARGGFIQMTPLNEKRAGHQAVLLADGRVMIMGGTEQVWVLKNQNGQSYLETDLSWIKNTAVIYNPDGLGRIDLELNMQVPRAFFTATPLDGEPPNATRFLIAGGFGEGGRLTALEKLTFEPARAGTPTFGPVYAQTEPLFLKAPRSGHTATRLGDGRIFFYGGTEPGGSSANAPVAEIFISETLGISLPTAFGDYDQWPNLYYHGASAFDDGTRVLIAGGMQKGSDGGSGEILSDPVSTALLFDFGTNEVTTLALNDPRAFHSVVTIPGSSSDRVVIFGGASESRLTVGNYESEQLVKNGMTYSIEYMTSDTGVLTLGIPRMAPTATLLLDGSVVFIGGAMPEPAEGNIAQKVILQSSETYSPVPP